MTQVGDEKPTVGETRVRVRYAETDQMGVVYHANYLVWFEIGRVEFIRQLGLDYRSMEREELIVQTRLMAARGAVIRFGYKIVRVEDGTVLCEGETVHVVVGRDMKKRSLPGKYAERFAAHLIS
jgi:acyl-CoA thioester hydrolase